MLKLNGEEIRSFLCIACGKECNISNSKQYLSKWSNETNAKYDCYCSDSCKESYEKFKNANPNPSGRDYTIKKYKNKWGSDIWINYMDRCDWTSE